MVSNETLPDVTRDKLIESAGEVFAEVGFNNATIREICYRAGANVAAVNYYFRDKLGLYKEVLASCLVTQQAAALSGNSAHTPDPKTVLKMLICGWFERNHASDRPGRLARIMAHEMANPTPALDSITESMRANYQRFRATVGKLIGHSPDDPRTRMCVHSIVGQILHYSQARPTLERLWPGLNLEDPEWRRAIATHIVNFSLAAMEYIAQQGVVRSEPIEMDRAARHNTSKVPPNDPAFGRLPEKSELYSYRVAQTAPR
jgi:AcrR family transcriptional regulator